MEKQNNTTSQKPQQNQQRILPSVCEVLIIGGGVSGASSLYSLHKAGVKNVVLIDVGECGSGNNNGKSTSDHAYIRHDSIYKGQFFQHAAKSGTAVMDSPTQTIKMMCNIYGCSSNYFMSHHGFEGARRYLNLGYQGLVIQKELAKTIAFPTEEQFNENLIDKGSLQVGEQDDEEEMLEEYENLKKLGFVGIEYWNKEKMQQELSGESNKFTCGLFYSKDAIINSQLYSYNLIQYILSQEPTYQLFENVPKVVKTKQLNDQAITKLIDGTKITSKYIVLCTGGLYLDNILSGILTPCYSYLISMKEPQSSINFEHRMNSPNSMNYFTRGFTHDWAVTKGHVRLSGEDHFSAFKPPREEERCQNLAKWIVNRFPYLKENENVYDVKYGVYSETPDKAPIVGTTSPQSRICYVVGCNAMGQSCLTYSGMLVAGLLGYTQLNDKEKDNLKLLTIRRFVLKL